jgi:tRNA pseudouridine38-40 synthase
MQRYRIIVEYDGGPYVGWQRQAEGRSVQGELEAALERLTGARTAIRGAGRTDAGVHAIGQVAHFDLERNVETDTIRDGLNAHLRDQPIAVLGAAAAEPDFDARFSATARHYAYRILDRRAPPAVDRGRVWHVTRPLDPDAMRAGAAALIGRHDFTSFRAAECQAKSPVKTLDRFELVRDGEELRIAASARSFLHSQVRSMVGTLVKVGTGSWPPGRVREILEARDRAECGPLAPPHGLYLMAVEYSGERAIAPADRESEDLPA